MPNLLNLDVTNSISTQTKELTNPIGELRKWSIFDKVGHQLLSRVKLVHVFGYDKPTAFLVTGDDEVYSVGINHYGSLGIGNKSPRETLTPLKVEALCGKQVASFSWSSSQHPLKLFSHPGHCFALTKAGQIYAWGYNENWELGLGRTGTVYTPTLIQGLRNKQVVQISTGAHHSLALTSEQKVYAWGYNGAEGRIGNGTAELNQATPFNVSPLISSHIGMKAVACGEAHSVALSTAGEVFIWGSNKSGQLGNRTQSDVPTPVKVVLPDNERIQKITCGLNHTMALAESGKLYVWGRNSDGQLGDGTVTDSSTPILMPGPVLIDDIASVSSRLNLSICISDSNIYIWGAVAGRTTTRPIETGLASMQDALWFYTKPQELMYTTLVFKLVGNLSPSLTEDLAMAFNNKSTADVTFVSRSEGKSIHVHKAILEIRSGHFRKMFQGDCTQSLESSIKIDSETSFKSFHALLLFLYTDKIQFPDDDFPNILDLLKLASRYCEKRLVEQCGFILQRGITIQNAVELYSVASKHNAIGLRDFALEFIEEHRKEIPQQLDRFELDASEMHKLLIAFTRPRC